MHPDKRKWIEIERHLGRKLRERRQSGRNLAWGHSARNGISRRQIRPGLWMNTFPMSDANPRDHFGPFYFVRDQAMELLEQCFGEGSNLSVAQMSMRTAVVFIFALVMIRVAGRRSFGQRNAFDSCVVVLLGAVLSRAIVGASPFIPTLCASFVMVLLHRLLALMSIKWADFERLVDGDERILVDHSVKNERQMRLGLISPKDLAEAVRKRLNTEDMGRLKKAVLERNGEISVIND